MIGALIFDFDGLILETEGPVFRSWQEVYQSFGLALSFPLWATTIGTQEAYFEPVLDLEQRLGRSLDRAQIEAGRRSREIEMIMAQPIQPGVVAYLSETRHRGLKIGLASSSSCRWVTEHLTRLRLIGYFDCIRARDDVQTTKPDPELYLSALEALGVTGECAIAFEDSPNGVLAAQRAGLFVVAVPNELTSLLPLDHADLRLSSLADMPLEALLAHVEAHRVQAAA